MQPTNGGPSASPIVLYYFSGIISGQSLSWILCTVTSTLPSPRGTSHTSLLVSSLITYPVAPNALSYQGSYKVCTSPRDSEQHCLHFQNNCDTVSLQERHPCDSKKKINMSKLQRKKRKERKRINEVNLSHHKGFLHIHKLFLENQHFIQLFFISAYASLISWSSSVNLNFCL